MDAAKVYMIAGASRGLGLGLVEGLLKQEDTVVVAGARSPDKAEGLQDLLRRYPDRLHTVVLDTTDEGSVKAAAAQVDKSLPEGIDYLVNMAGVADAKLICAVEAYAPSKQEASDYRRVLRVNTVGPFLTTQAFYPLLKKRETRVVVNVSSGAGSITLNRAGKHWTNGKIIAYASSKAALNMQTNVLAGALQPEGFTVVSWCPGWVATDMGTRSDMIEVAGVGVPDLTIEQSTAKQLELLHRLTTADSGKFFLAPTGKELPY